LRNLFEIPAELGAVHNQLAESETEGEASIPVNEPATEQLSV